MAHDSNRGEPKPTTQDLKPGDSDSARPSASEIEDIGGDAMGGHSRTWQVLKGESEETERKTARSTSGSDDGVGSIGASNEAAIEMSTGVAHTTHAPSGSGSPKAEAGRTGAGAGTETGVAGVEYKVYKRRWFGLLQLTLLNIIVSWDWLTFSPVASHAARYFNTTETVINWLSTAFLFSFVFITPVVIYVLHLGPKKSIVTAAAFLLVGNWIRYAGSHSSSGGLFGVVMFGQILCGLAQPFVLAAPTRYSDLWFTNRGRVAATALSSLANPFGAALGQLVVPFWVTQPGDVSHMVLYVSIISTIGAVPAFFIPSQPPTPVAPSAETPKLSIGASARILSNQLEFWLLFIPFAMYVGLFNSISSLLNQILLPHGYNEEEAGIAGAVLIVVGLVASAISSPIIDRTKSYLLAIRLAVPLIGLCYLIFIWMPNTRDGGGVAGPYVVMAILGASSFSMLPIVVEYLVELTHPISPEITSTLAWSGGQLLGGIIIIVSGALRDGADGDPPGDMRDALILHAVLGLVVVPLPLCLGLFGRNEKLLLRRVKSDQEARDSTSTGHGREGL
ncbi:hypothetical protein CHGG_09101 [Chaetomium globosum CBS 148.51]|uniref:Major facilitator superfamily (MFS) profile domain-containing protein n=1 Tax=Chaetomium globosum (strain ATCC 6205 / CBS 148.51 / DSM 1962 / NBRC 6347 / NRRL 1970) TaxID=306901 RepID=Q2GSF3_CHAGB|nr:uncharacterized protein CHGG_09101 [Chaetomium globosum CBS 148.51]EAQ85087.1 hypothetical protein CHGG_09101 [Chaetomium globosum CBS 148.51]